MKIRCLAGIFVMFLTTTVHPQSAAVCTSHFNNQSNFRWSIYNFDGKKSALFIPPHSTLTISWGTTSTVTISGDLPSRPFKQQFSVKQLDTCVAFQVQGSTGPVTINSPGNGDITTCAGGC